MIDFELDEMKVIWNYYIWINGYVFFKIDRVFFNFVWVREYGYICVVFREENNLDYNFSYMNIIYVIKRNINYLDFLMWF